MEIVKLQDLDNLCCLNVVEFPELSLNNRKHRAYVLRLLKIMMHKYLFSVSTTLLIDDYNGPNIECYWFGVYGSNTVDR